MTNCSISLRQRRQSDGTVEAAGRCFPQCLSGGADALRTWDGDLYASGVHGTNADKALAAHAPDMAAMVAGMHEEWGVTYAGVNHDGRHTEWGHDI